MLKYLGSRRVIFLILITAFGGILDFLHGLASVSLLKKCQINRFWKLLRWTFLDVICTISTFVSVLLIRALKWKANHMRFKSHSDFFFFFLKSCWCSLLMKLLSFKASLLLRLLHKHTRLLLPSGDKTQSSNRKWQIYKKSLRLVISANLVLEISAAGRHLEVLKDKN